MSNTQTTSPQSYANLREQTTLPELIALDVEQEKLPVGERDYIMALVKEHPFANSVVVDRRRVAADLATFWPKLAGHTEQAQAIFHHIEEAVRNFPVEDAGQTFLLRIEVSPAHLVPLNMLENKEPMTIVSFNGVAGTMQTSTVPASETPPDLRYMEVPAGIIVMLQPALSTINPFRNEFSLSNESGANLYRERATDKQLSGIEAWVPVSEMPKSAEQQERDRLQNLRSAEHGDPLGTNKNLLTANALPWMLGAGLAAASIYRNATEEEELTQGPRGLAPETPPIGVPRPGEVPGINPPDPNSPYYTPPNVATQSQATSGMVGSTTIPFEATSAVMSNLAYPATALQTPYARTPTGVLYPAGTTPPISTSVSTPAGTAAYPTASTALPAGVVGAAASNTAAGTVIRGTGYTEQLSSTPSFQETAVADQAEDERRIMVGQGYIPDEEYVDQQEAAAIAVEAETNIPDNDTLSESTSVTETAFETAAAVETHAIAEDDEEEEDANSAAEVLRETRNEPLLVGNSTEESDALAANEGLRGVNPYVSSEYAYLGNDLAIPSGALNDQNVGLFGAYPSSSIPPNGIDLNNHLPPVGRTVSNNATIPAASGTSRVLGSETVVEARRQPVEMTTMSPTTPDYSTLSEATDPNAPTTAATTQTHAPQNIGLSTNSNTSADSGVSTVVMEMVPELVLAHAAVTTVADAPLTQPEAMPYHTEQDELSDTETLLETGLWGMLRRRLRGNKNDNTSTQPHQVLRVADAGPEATPQTPPRPHRPNEHMKPLNDDGMQETL